MIERVSGVWLIYVYIYITSCNIIHTILYREYIIDKMKTSKIQILFNVRYA